MISLFNDEDWNTYLGEFQNYLIHCTIDGDGISEDELAIVLKSTLMAATA